MLLLFVGNPDLTRDLSPPRVPRSQVSPEEVQKIVAGMDDPSALQAGGVHVGGEKYMFIQSDDRLVAAKKVRFAFRVTSIARRTPPSAPRRTSPAPNPRPRHRPRATIPIQTPRRDPRASEKHPRPLPPRSGPLTPARRPRPRRRRGAPACSCARRPRAWSSAPTTRTSRAETATPAWVTSPIISSTTACDRFESPPRTARDDGIFFRRDGGPVVDASRGTQSAAPDVSLSSGRGARRDCHSLVLSTTSALRKNTQKAPSPGSPGPGRTRRRPSGPAPRVMIYRRAKKKISRRSCCCSLRRRRLFRRRDPRPGGIGVARAGPERSAAGFGCSSLPRAHDG